MVTLSQSNLTKAINKAVRYLHQIQQPAGDFQTMSSPNKDMQDAKPYPKSVYVTTFVLHALAQLRPSPLIKEIQERAINFLLREQEDNGAWNYEGRDNHKLPNDLDNTACAIAALAQLDQKPELSFYALLWQSESAPGGPYYTWLDINDREDDPRARNVDALVNANILFCCGLLDLSLPKTVYYLEQVIRAEAYDSESLFTFSPHFLIYTLSRAYADGGVRMLDTAMSIMQDYVLSKLPPPHLESSIFNLACLAVSLHNMKMPTILLRPYLVPLLTSQQADGSWSVAAAYAGYAPNFDGSSALTTALAIEALSKYQNT